MLGQGAFHASLRFRPLSRIMRATSSKESVLRHIFEFPTNIFCANLGADRRFRAGSGLLLQPECRLAAQQAFATGECAKEPWIVVNRCSKLKSPCVVSSGSNLARAATSRARHSSAWVDGWSPPLIRSPPFDVASGDEPLKGWRIVSAEAGKAEFSQFIGVLEPAIGPFFILQHGVAINAMGLNRIPKPIWHQPKIFANHCRVRGIRFNGENGQEGIQRLGHISTGDAAIGNPEAPVQPQHMVDAEHAGILHRRTVYIAKRLVFVGCKLFGRIGNKAPILPIWPQLIRRSPQRNALSNAVMLTPAFPPPPRRAPTARSRYSPRPPLPLARFWV